MSRQHLEQIESALSSAPQTGAIVASWRRCVNDYGVDVEDSRAPRILTRYELGESREPIDNLVRTAQAGVDRLYRQVRDAGYTVLLCNTDGIAVLERAEAQHASEFRYWGVCLGGVWSEAAEGTNGIGTCIAEERPVSVHRGQHFRSRNTDLSCSGAPIFGHDGKLIAVLDVSATDPKKSEHAHALTGMLTLSAAQAVEERFFRERFHQEWIIAAADKAAETLLLAVDGGLRIVGANRAARAGFDLDDTKLRAGVGLWALFHADKSPFVRSQTTDLPTVFTDAVTGEALPALVTPPERFSGGGLNAGHSFHTRPRPEMLASVKALPPAAPIRGGLPPAAMRRIEEYVAAHIGDGIDLAELADLAGLSVFHFARQFKHSMGVTPHAYLVRKRLESARDILLHSDLPLSCVAAMTGFSDQSHLTRLFRRIYDITPGQLRRTQGAGIPDRGAAT